MFFLATMLFCVYKKKKIECLNFQITILVAAEGVHKLPTINGTADLKEALQKLGSIPASRTLVRIDIFPNCNSRSC